METKTSSRCTSPKQDIGNIACTRSPRGPSGGPPPPPTSSITPLVLVMRGADRGTQSAERPKLTIDHWPRGGRAAGSRVTTSIGRVHSAFCSGADPPPNLLHHALGFGWTRNTARRESQPTIDHHGMASWWPRCPPRVPASARPAGARIGPTPCRPPGVPDGQPRRPRRNAAGPGEGAAGHSRSHKSTPL